MGAHTQACLRLPVAFATQTGAPHRQAPTPKHQIAAFVNRAPYRLFRPLDSGHGLWPWAPARDGVPREGKSSRGRPERSAAKSKGDEVGAPGLCPWGPTRRSPRLPASGGFTRLWRVYPPLEGPITGFMWTCLRLPVRCTQTGAVTHRQAQTGTRRTSCQVSPLTHKAGII